MAAFAGALDMRRVTELLMFVNRRARITLLILQVNRLIEIALIVELFLLLIGVFVNIRIYSRL